MFWSLLVCFICNAYNFRRIEGNVFYVRTLTFEMRKLGIQIKM